MPAGVRADGTEHDDAGKSVGTAASEHEHMTGGEEAGSLSGTTARESEEAPRESEEAPRESEDTLNEHERGRPDEIEE